VFFVVAASAILWGLFLDLVMDPPLRRLVSFLITGFVIIWIVTDIWFNFRYSMNELVKSEWRFFTRGSFGDMYWERKIAGVQIGWPVAAKAKELLGPETRLLALETRYGTGAVPGRDIESEVNYAYKDWQIMCVAEPDQAKEALKKEGLNYFILDLEINQQRTHGALAQSPLFAPDNLQKYFEIVLCEGTGCVLTWRGESTQTVPWPDDFAERWSEKRLLTGFPDLYNRLKHYYDHYNGRPHPVYLDPTLPPVNGWQ
jgi:hypothetical protein